MNASRSCRSCLSVLSRSQAQAPASSWNSARSLFLRYSSATSLYSTSTSPSSTPSTSTEGPVRNRASTPPLSPAPASSSSSSSASAAADADSPIMASPTYRLARALKRRAPGLVDTYVAYSATADMAKLCWVPADYYIGPDTMSLPSSKTGEDGTPGGIPKTADGEDLGVPAIDSEGVQQWWFNEAKLQPTFSTWSQVSMLHMYMIVVRLRLFPASSTKIWHQHLLDHFFQEAERRMEELHGLTMRAVQQRYLKDLYTQWRGILAAYDEAFIKGDAVLGAALWRNVFKADQDVDPVVLAQVVAYTRRGISMLDRLGDDEFAMGTWSFGEIEDERNGVLAKSRLLN